MDNGADLNILSGTLAPGASVPSDDTLYIESSGWGTSTFNVTVTDGTGAELGTLGFTEDSNLYTLAQPPASGSQVLVDWLNPVDTGGNQALINISVLPFSYGPATWMTSTSGLGDLPLGHIATLGAHDAGTYGYSSILAPDDNEIITQTATIGHQLSVGARYFDLRPGGALDPANPLATVLYHSHGGHLCAPFSDMLADIQSFAKSNPREIIYLALTHFDTQDSGPVVLPQLNNGSNPSDPNTVLSYVVCDQLVQALGPYLLPNDITATDTLQSVWDGYPGRNIVLFMDLPVVNGQEVAFGAGPGQIDIPAAHDSVQLMSSGVVANWGNYADTDSFEDLVAWVQQNIPPCALTTWNLLQCQLTGAFGTFLVPLTVLARSSNVLIRQALDPSLDPAAVYAQMFTSTGNLVLLDGIHGSITPWTVLTNLHKRFANAAPAAAAVNGSLVAIKKGSGGDNGWFPWTTADGQTWSGGSFLVNPSTQQGALTSFAAGLSSSGTQLCLAYKDMVSTGIWAAFSSTGSANAWSGAVRLPGSVNTLQAPAPVYFGGVPRVFYRGSGDSFIWYSSASAAGGWTDAVPLPNSVNTSHTPAPVAFEGGLSVVFKGEMGDQTIYIIHSADGVNWPAVPQPLASPVPAEPIETWVGPAAVAFDGKLYVAWKGAVNANLYFACSADGLSWSAPAQVPGATSGAAPALAVYENMLYVLFEPLFCNDELQACATRDGVTWAPVETIT